eukprot:g5280.t1
MDLALQVSPLFEDSGSLVQGLDSMSATEKVPRRSMPKAIPSAQSQRRIRQSLKSRGRSGSNKYLKSKRKSSDKKKSTPSTKKVGRSSKPELKPSPQVVRKTSYNRLGKKSSMSSMTIDLDLQGRGRRSSYMRKVSENNGEIKRVDSGSEVHHVNRNSAKMMLLEEHNGIPIKETMKVLYSVRRMKFVWELLILVVSMVLFFIITSTALNRRTAYEQQLTIQELLQDEEFAGSTYKKNFDEIRSIEEFWSWAEGPLVTNLYLDKRPGTPHRLPPSEQDYVASYLRIVGGIQIRQFRVSNDSCKERRRVDTTWGHRLDTKDGSCYNSFGNDKDWKEPVSWASKLGEPEPTGPYAYLYGHWGHCDSRKCAFGPLQDEVDYGEGGSAVNIPPPSQLSPLNPNATYSAATLIAKLKALAYFDRSTRSIVVECLFFNTNTETMSTAQFIVEQYESGLIESSVKYRHAQISLFDSRTSVVRLTCEVAFIVLFSYQLQRELRRIIFTRPCSRYFINPFSWLEIFYFTFNILFFANWYSYVFDEQRASFDVNTTTFVSMWNVSHRLMKTYQYAGWAMLTVSFKMLRLMSLNRRMSVLWQALAESAADVMAFMLSFFILLLGFGYMAYMMWGVNTKVFTTIYTSTFTLLRYWIDEFPYENLYDSQPDMYYSFFIPFSLLLTLVVQNVFVAIILNSFTKIHMESSIEHWKKDLTHVSYELYKRFALGIFIMRLRCQKRKCWSCCNYRKTNTNKGNFLASWYSLDDLLVSEEDFAMAEKKVGERQFQRYQVYACELKFFSIMAKAARVTRRNVMAGGNITSLYEYFRHAYREHPTEVTSFMSIQELCAITKPKSLHNKLEDEKFDQTLLQVCDHENCMACKIIECYNEFKSVLVIGGKERESKIVQRPSEVDMRAQRFDVVKTNNMGRQQRRILIVDQNRREIRSYDNRMRLHVILPLKHLQQLENLEADPCTLELSFKEGVYSYCELEFRSRHERTRFIQSIMKQHEAVEEDKTTEADKDPLVRLQRQMEDVSTLLIALHQKLDKKAYARQEAREKNNDKHSSHEVPNIPSRESTAAALRLISRLPTANRWVESHFKHKRAYYPPRVSRKGRRAMSKRSTQFEETLSVQKFVEKSATATKKTSMSSDKHSGRKNNEHGSMNMEKSVGIEMTQVGLSSIDMKRPANDHSPVTVREAKGDREVKDDFEVAEVSGLRGKMKSNGPDLSKTLEKQDMLEVYGSGIGLIKVGSQRPDLKSESETPRQLKTRKSVLSMQSPLEKRVKL